MFVYCYNEEAKQKLILNGYNFVSEKQVGDKVIFIFMNNGKKINFDKNEVFYTNKMTY